MADATGCKGKMKGTHSSRTGVPRQYLRTAVLTTETAGAYDRADGSPGSPIAPASRVNRRLAYAPEHEAAIAVAQYLRHRRTHRSTGHPRPRVLQLLATGGTGGAQESYTGLLLRLDRARYEVRALSLSRGTVVQRLRRLGVQVDIIDETDDEAAIRELAAYLRRNEIDLLHSHMFRAEVIGTRAAVAVGTPVIMATVHSSRVRSPGDVADLASLTRQMDRLIVPSASIEAKVRGEGRDARFSVIPTGVDRSRFALPAPRCSLRRDHEIPGDALVIGAVARLEPEKGLRYLVEAMPAVVEAVPNAWLAIIGEGSLHGELREQGARLPEPANRRVVFAGRRDDISAVTADLDIAVLPSMREAQGISVLEAMARRKPVVASAVGGLPEVISDGVDGLLVPPENPSALAEALIRLGCSPELRAALGEAGYQTVAERYSIEAMVRQIEAVYDEELARAGVSLSVSSGASSKGRPPAERATLEVPPG
jgi:glycosyltransferase involved in cell wall biosynthesis